MTASDLPHAKTTAMTIEPLHHEDCAARMGPMDGLRLMSSTEHPPPDDDRSSPE